MTEKLFWTPKQVFMHLEMQQEKGIPYSIPNNVYCTVDFKWNEVLLTKDTFFQMPTMEILENLQLVMSNVIQPLRTKVDKPIRINSSWRTPAKQKELIRQYNVKYNAWLKSGKIGNPPNKPSETSLHLEGLALDISVIGDNQKQLQTILNSAFAGEMELGWDYTHVGLTTFSKSYLQRHGLFCEDIYKKLILDTTKLPKSHRDSIEKRFNPANWNIRYPSTFDPVKNAEFFKNSSIGRTNADSSHLLPEIKMPLQSADDSVVDTDNTPYLQGHIEINVNKDEDSSNHGLPTGLAADLFSEEEIEELKKRLEHERLPQETLKKMGEYHKRKFFERLKAETTYEGDGSDLTLANFIDKDGNFTLSPQKITPPKPQPPIRNSNTTKTKDLSKDEKWQSFRKIFRTFFAIPDDNGKPMGKINSADVYNAIDVMETMKKAMHESEVVQIPEQKDAIKESMQFEFLSDEAQTEMMQSALSQTSNQIKTDVKTEILDEISRQTMFPDREHVENIMRDVFDDVIYRRGYKRVINNP